MPAAPQITPPTRLGVIAGSGCLPGLLLEACDRRHIETFVVAFQGRTDPAITIGRNHLWTRPGAPGKAIRALKSHGVRDLVSIGALRRPSPAELRPDFKALQFLARTGFSFRGDDGLLRALKIFLEAEGFRMHGVQEFLENLLMPAGTLGRVKPLEDQKRDIARGIEVARTLGALDVGQAVIVQGGFVLGVEGAEGTDALIRRCGALHRTGRGGVLVKLCKPQQDRALDLPAIGPDTIRAASESGLSGIAVQAGASLLVDPETVVTLADSAGLFVIGIENIS
ncbi:MAG: UDP-2,3-diacylglucosamine diphosphatase LpxI [Alphaproteobacteria bacterium]|nr:UDP-2,3-diacylglucosamine diphosphatase LpxI [Alphaproteobacteria bacterium]